MSQGYFVLTLFTFWEKQTSSGSELAMSPRFPLHTCFPQQLTSLPPSSFLVSVAHLDLSCAFSAFPLPYPPLFSDSISLLSSIRLVT